MDRIIEKSFHINLILLQIIGLHSPSKSTCILKLYAYILHLICVLPVPILGSLYIFFDDESDLMEMSYNGIVIVQVFGNVLKSLSLIQNSAKVKQLIYFALRKVSPKLCLEEQQIINECTGICQRNSTAFLIGVILCYCFWITTPLWTDTTFPLNLWLPFDQSANWKNYCTAYLIVTIGVACSGIIAIGVDPLIGGLALQAATYLKLLKYNLQHLSDNVDQEILKINPKSHSEREALKSEIIYRKIKYNIEFHKQIFRFFKLYVKCFSFPIFSQFMGSTLIFGLCCIRLIKFPFFSANFLVTMSYFVMLIIQIYFYCYYGTILVEESNSLISDVYISNWYEYDIKSQKALLTLMEASKKPMIATAGKIFDLSLDTLTMILKRSYSLVAVLKNF